MKKNFYTIGSIIILIFVAIAFVLPSTLGSGMGTGGILFGSYGKKEIRYEQNSDFANMVSQLANYYSQTGQQIDTYTSLEIFSQAFSHTVQQIAYEDAVKKSGWSVSSEEIKRAMRPYFYDENGNYSAKLYQQAEKTAITELQNALTKNIIIARYTNDIFGSSSSYLTEQIGNYKLFGLKSSEGEKEFIKTLGEEKRSFDIATFKMSDYPHTEQVAFGIKNIDKFVRYNMSVITVDTKKEASDILKKIKNGTTTFEDAVGEYSKKSYSNSDGKLTENLNHNLERLVNAGDFSYLIELPVESVSRVVKTEDAFSIFRIDGASEVPDFENEENVREVFNYLNTYESSIVEDFFVEKANQFVEQANATTFNQACNLFGVVKKSTSSFPLNFANSSVMTSISIDGLPEIAENERFLSEAFALENEGDISSPIVVGEDIIVLKLNSKTQSKDTTESVEYELSSYDTTSASAALMQSEKVKDNVSSAFFKNFL